ncbi:TetR/AcrR family transcriptional regulator [Actinomadura sp. 7K507]|uniref:TetR/AcrR family transcriptional regulator n=1 Tax=Actinomadura sp. 7K507 TaxID=2530365 RepID=UPI0010483355|nr:TetR/AcrR family transcriptional regulator [Actinomadura sp. 7K507]TDC96604.1 TetR/AcrR family transcriptional regulator [Actinomadura sp. 7K507]
MSRPPAPQGRTGRPPRTSRAQILEAARRIIDREGWEKLTVRRLASELGIGPTTLYHHVRDKEDLLVLVLNDYLGRLERPELPSDPRERIIAGAIAMHDAAADWPWAAEAVTTDGFLGRLDAPALWMVEAIVAGAADYGCTPAQSVFVFRSIWYYTVGEVLVRTNSARKRAGDLRPRSLSTLDASQLPHLAAIGDLWGEVSGQDTYPLGLRAFVNGLLAQAASATPE